MSGFSLKLDEGDIQVIGAALMELPGKVCIPIIDKINAQLAEQQEPKAEQPPEAGSPQS